MNYETHPSTILGDHDLIKYATETLDGDVPLSGTVPSPCIEIDLMKDRIGDIEKKVERQYAKQAKLSLNSETIEFAIYSWSQFQFIVQSFAKEVTKEIIQFDGKIKKIEVILKSEKRKRRKSLSKQQRQNLNQLILRAKRCQNENLNMEMLQKCTAQLNLSGGKEALNRVFLQMKNCLNRKEWTNLNWSEMATTLISLSRDFDKIKEGMKEPFDQLRLDFCSANFLVSENLYGLSPKKHKVLRKELVELGEIFDIYAQKRDALLLEPFRLIQHTLHFTIPMGLLKYERGYSEFLKFYNTYLCAHEKWLSIPGVTPIHLVLLKLEEVFALIKPKLIEQAKKYGFGEKEKECLFQDLEQISSQIYRFGMLPYGLDALNYEGNEGVLKNLMSLFLHNLNELEQAVSYPKTIQFSRAKQFLVAVKALSNFPETGFSHLLYKPVHIKQVVPTISILGYYEKKTLNRLNALQLKHLEVFSTMLVQGVEIFPEGSARKILETTYLFTGAAKI